MAAPSDAAATRPTPSVSSGGSDKSAGGSGITGTAAEVRSALAVLISTGNPAAEAVASGGAMDLSSDADILNVITATAPTDAATPSCGEAAPPAGSPF